MTLDTLPDLLTVDELQAVTRCGRRQAYELVRRGDIASIRIGRTIRIPKAAVQAWLAGPSYDDGASPARETPPVVTVVAPDRPQSGLTS